MYKRIIKHNRLIILSTALILFCAFLFLLFNFYAKNNNWVSDRKIIKVFINHIQINTVISETNNELAQGLGGTPSLCRNCGMLFKFSIPDIYSFWMKDMNYPIDIIWIDENDNILYIKENATVESYPEQYTSNQKSLYVLEVNKNFTNENNIKIGDKIYFNKDETKSLESIFENNYSKTEKSIFEKVEDIFLNKKVLDKVLYDKKLTLLANNPREEIPPLQEEDVEIVKLWPVKSTYPNYGAILPFNRIVSYYGNFYSKKMGVLGEYEEDKMIQMLLAEVTDWEKVDQDTPVIPAIHYIVTTAQLNPGRDNKYRLRMPDTEIDKAVDIASKINGIVFLDVQVGLSDLKDELIHLEKYLKMSQIHLGIDPEFYMRDGKKPGTVIGTVDAKEINETINYLSQIVKDNNLPPKILVIHRFTRKMLTNYQDIKPTPEVQVVIDMDGWGIKEKKINTYKNVIYSEPVQFAGFKLFYKNDTLDKTSRMLTKQEILNLTPIPIYIQYQ